MAGVKGKRRGKGNLGAWGAKGRKERNACKETIVFSIFSRSDSERKNSAWSELIKCQSST